MLFPYRGHPIKAENFEGFKEDTDTMKRFPLRAWTDSAYHETQYVHLEIPKLGLHPVAIVTLKDENVLNLRFPVLSSDRNSKWKNLKNGLNLYLYVVIVMGLGFQKSGFGSGLE